MMFINVNKFKSGNSGFSYIYREYVIFSNGLTCIS